MKTHFFKILSLSFLFSVLFIRCEKPAPEPESQIDEEALHTVTLKLKGFTKRITPLADQSAMNSSRLMTTSSSNRMSTSASESGPEEQHLYFWSFNNDDLVPEIAVGSAAPSLSFQAVDTSPSFTAGFGLSPYPAGKALSLRGLQALVITMPLSGVSQITTLAFDVASSGTGPKNFRIYSSTDDGTTYRPLSEDNQFSNTKDNTRNSYEFDLSQLGAVQAERLTIKIEPFEGERGEANDYDQNRGTFKLDNFRLSGLYNAEHAEEPTDDISKIQYFIFNANDHTFAAQGNTTFDPSTDGIDLSFKLPRGTYYGFITSNVSKAALVLPPRIAQASDLYISNSFANHQALIFGAQIPHLEIDNHIEVDAVLKRYFSEIRFEFTDGYDLSEVHKIRISPEHEDFLYAPFNAQTTERQAASTLVLHPSFDSSNKSLSFHQFIGDVSDPVHIGYVVDVYNENDELLRTFTVTASIKNNVQLLFKGELLTDVDRNNQFQIEWNQLWDESLTQTF
ncbi:hypothetical protein [Olivibacter sp. XZL3]|uniref:hypothetical protein n=1 Tax=Olivibacter sp. XZL3 TaxID=1735116 RepID=UPI001066BD1B|nr:hypothetical protein [Olivibacter sp. XZL3]